MEAWAAALVGISFGVSLAAYWRANRAQKVVDMDLNNKKDEALRRIVKSMRGEADFLDTEEDCAKQILRSYALQIERVLTNKYLV